MLKKLTAILLAVMILALCMGAGAEQEKVWKIGVVQYVTHVALDQARDGFIKALEDNGYADGENIQLDLQNGQADTSNLSTISDQFVANDMDLVLAIGTGAAQAIAGKTETIPILGTAITDYEVAKLVKTNEEPGYNISGTSDMNPIKEQIALIPKFVPEAKTVGLIYTSSEDNSILQAKLAREAIEKMGLSYTEVTVTNSNDVQQAMQELCGKCDVIYIPTDNVVASSMPIVYGVASENKMFVVAAEASMCKNGGMVTLGIDYFKLGYQTGLMAIRVMNGEDISRMPIETAADVSYFVNGTTCREVGVEIPEEFKEFVVEVEQ